MKTIPENLRISILSLHEAIASIQKLGSTVNKLNKSMKKEKKLQSITEDIRKTLPRLMELEKGCLINIGVDSPFEIVNIHGNEVIACPNERYITVINKNYIKIIGKEPMLNDVMEWFREKDLGIIVINDTGDVLVESSKKLNLSMFHWDLSKPYLKDQSEELINFLYELLN